jgi:hypothetical protein
MVVDRTIASTAGCPPPNSAEVAKQRERSRLRRVRRDTKRKPILAKSGDIYLVVDKWGRRHTTRAECDEDAIHNAVNRIGCRRRDIREVEAVSG